MRLTYVGSTPDFAVRHPLTGVYLTGKRGEPLEFDPEFDLDEYPLGADWVAAEAPADAPAETPAKTPKTTPAKPAPTPEGDA